MNNRDTFEQAARKEVERSPEMVQKNPAVRHPPAKMFIAKVVSDAAGAGVYNCYIQKLDATNWGNSSAVSINKNTDSVAVLNMAEDAATSHNLDAGDYILCWKKTDDEGNSRYVGNEIIGRYTFGVW
jgi:hypothetical protein